MMPYKEDDPRAFELLVKWLYQGEIDDVTHMPLDRKWDYADACQVRQRASSGDRQEISPLASADVD